MFSKSDRDFVWLVLAVASFLQAGVGLAKEVYVAPQGSARGEGSRASLLDLGTALSNEKLVKPGDTVWPAAALVDRLVQAAREAERAKVDAAAKPGPQAGIRLGPWHGIGPFKDAEYGLFSRSFETPLGPEEDVVARAAEPADLKEVYHSVPLVGMPNTERRWVEHPEWTDGYFHLVPVGPPPSRNEAVYLYRTISAEEETAVDVHFVTRDAARVWLNGKPVADAPIRNGAGHRLLHVRFSLPLSAGDNRLLVKIVNCFQKNGFSFAVEGLHAVHPYLQGQPVASEKRAFTPAYEPYASALWQRAGPDGDPPAPSWYVRRETWRETLLASREARRIAQGQRTASPDPPYNSGVLRQADGPKHLRLNVSGLERLVLLCTIGGDDYGYDDTIWAEPKLVAADGKEVCLIDLEPARAEVGFLRLFINENLTGKPLTIGGRQFERGFWAHAPSVLVFRLDGQYEWFDTWIGLDSLATQSGSSEFIVSDSVPAELAGIAELSGPLECQLRRDFPDRRLRHEIYRELTDGIWAEIESHEQEPLLGERYAQTVLKTLSLPAEASDLLPAATDGQTRALVREVYHRVKRFQESLEKVRRFRFDVDPLPNFDPPTLAMERARDTLLPTPGGAAYLDRLAPVKNLARDALADYAGSKPGAAEKIVRAGEAIDEFWADRIRALGPIVFVRHPSFGRINAVDPYNTEGKGPASICVFDPSQPDEPPRVIYDDPHGSVFTMSLSYDAETIFFAAKRKGVPGGWHIYEIGADGRNFRQITGGETSNDISPLQLPNGEVMFVSSRAHNVLVCQAGRAGVLYVCNRDGTNVRRVSGNTLSDHSPTIMDDGRVLFTRWDYGVDKGVFERQAVWTMNPDGSRLQLFFGNTVLDPNAFWQPAQVPGRPEVVATFGGHHAGPYGVIGLVWNRLGVEAPRGEGFRWIIPEYPTYFDGDFSHGYVDPCPVDEHEFLVSYGGDGNRRNRIYLLDDRGNKKCVWEEAKLGCYHPMPLCPRRRPPALAPTIEPPEFRYVDPVVANIEPDGRQGTFLMTDVYQGLEPHVRRGEVKAIQIMEQVPKTRPHTGGYAWNVTPTIGRGTFYVRRLIGTVPVEPDGSAHFAAPALRDISFNVLDAEGRVLQKMGSTTQVMPGETQSCVGCHESRRSASVAGQGVPLAAQRSPSMPRRPDWGTRGIVDYVEVVQPVWDKYCVECHGGPRPDGNLDLSGDKTRYFNMSYNMLIDRGFVHHVPMNGADHDLTTPKANGSLASRLLEYIEADHGGQVLPREDRQRVYTWIDANVPYYHTYLYTDGAVNGARDRWYDELPEAWFRKDFAPVFMRRCFNCHQRTVDISDAWLGRAVYTVSSRVWTDTTLMDQGLHIEEAIRTFGPAHRINLTHPDWSQVLTAPLVEEAGGLGLCKDRDGKPVFQDTNDPDYQAILHALRKGKAALDANPRVDMLPRPTEKTAESYAESLRRPRVMPVQEQN